MRIRTLPRRLITGFLILVVIHEVISADESTVSFVNEVTEYENITAYHSVSKVSTPGPVLSKESLAKKNAVTKTSGQKAPTTKLVGLSSPNAIFKTIFFNDVTHGFPSTSSSPATIKTVKQKASSSVAVSAPKDSLSPAASTKSSRVFTLSDELRLSSSFHASTDLFSATTPTDNSDYVGLSKTGFSSTISPASSSEDSLSFPSNTMTTSQLNESEESVHSTKTSSNLSTSTSFLTRSFTYYFTQISDTSSRTSQIQGSDHVMSSTNSEPSSQPIVHKDVFTSPLSSAESSATSFKIPSLKMTQRVPQSDSSTISSEYTSAAHSADALSVTSASTESYGSLEFAGDSASSSKTDILQTNFSWQTPHLESTSNLNASTSRVYPSSEASVSSTASSAWSTSLVPHNSSSKRTSILESAISSISSSILSTEPMATDASTPVLSTLDAYKTLPSTIHSTPLLSEEMTTIMHTSVLEDVNEMCSPMRETGYPRDCAEIRRTCEKTFLVNGEYMVRPMGYPYTAFPVYCDFQTDGGNWTIIQRRIDGSINFERSWQDYKNGFGFLNTEFWLGNEKLHYLTSQTTYEIRIELKNIHNDLYIAKYSNFRVGDEGVYYRLILGPYSGNAGNQLSKHEKASFSTPDADHDSSSSSNCADIHGGGWWFVECDWCNLNGVYGVNDNIDGIEWIDLPGGSYGLRATEMKIRPL